jgi:HEAT repeat protein
MPERENRKIPGRIFAEGRIYVGLLMPRIRPASIPRYLIKGGIVMSRFAVYSIVFVMSISFWAGRTAAAGEAAWSQESNGLQARLSMRRSHVSNGTGIIVTYLELKNVSDIGNPMLVNVDPKGMKFRVTNADGRDVPISGGAFDGMIFDLPDLVLPHDSSICFRIGPRGWGIPGDMAALVDLGSDFGWVLPRDGKSYYLQGVLEIAKEKEIRNERGIRWHGRLELPRVRIPTEPESLDPATLGPIIDDLGAKMLAKNTRVSEAAVRGLSLIDDPRVIPWYVKAIKTDRYDLKFDALGRLARLEGDEALEGLKIGMATQGEDIGNCSTPALAQDLSNNIRLAAAYALARSPHPRAKALLLSMHDDRYAGVRLAVIQAAARLETPEWRALLQSHAHDPDALVRDEAARLLKLPEIGPAK